MFLVGLVLASLFANAGSYFDQYLLDAVKGEQDYCRLVVAPNQTEACLKKIDSFISAVNSCDTSLARYEEAKISDTQLQQEFLSGVEVVEVPHRIKSVFKLLTESASPADWKLTAYESEEIAAQSSISGHIIISSKLLKILTAGEVAAVLAHEMGHTVKKHSQQFGCLAMAWTLKDQPLNLAYSAFNKEANAAYPNGQAWNKLSHNAEFEADAYAVTLLKNVGANPLLMARALEKLASPSGLVTSHPELSARVIKARELGKKIQDTGFRYVNF